ncbi:hypothetical protein LOAG_06389 [Loa loa]|uniref:Uncharacterized protein n=2 Tax=Loa loa TaxID=7209 RepID=A0A1S0TY28_LOALO|nr:hypothetical protein LOAG_06389 [Loa loa]EFO22103.1 hypothetical protein LOAG_06389 [Loa loa]
MEIFLFACTATLLFAQGSSSVMRQKEKLGQTVRLEFGDGVMDIQASIPKSHDGQVDRMDILKDGKITKYGRERYGGRLSFRNGTLIIKDLTASDTVSYFYFFQGDPKKPAAIDLILE